MRNGIETIRKSNVFNHKFMGWMRLIVKDAQTRWQLEQAKKGELDLDRHLISKRKMQLNGHIAINSKQSFGVRTDEISIATPSDIGERKIFEFKRYRKLRVEHKLTRRMRDFGERKEQEIRDNESRKVAKL